MPSPQYTNAPTTDTLQKMFNQSFDHIFNLNTVELVGYNAAINGMYRVAVNNDGSLTSGAGIPSYDYFGVTNPNSTTDVYTYKVGGSGGTTVATATIVYTDTTKQNISSFTKS